MNARQLLTDALVEIGAIGAADTPGDPLLLICLRSLNRVLSSWQARRLYVYTVTEVVATVGGTFATIGPGQQFDCATPQSLQRGCYIVRGGQSYPLPVWDREGYNSVSMKALANDYPDGVYYDRAGQVFFTQSMTPAEVHLQVLIRLPNFATLDEVHVLPDGYEHAIYMTMCERLPPSFQLAVSADTAREAASARRALRIANTDVPSLTSPSTGGSGILTNWQ